MAPVRVGKNSFRRTIQHSFSRVESRSRDSKRKGPLSAEVTLVDIFMFDQEVTVWGDGAVINVFRPPPVYVILLIAFFVKMGLVVCLCFSDKCVSFGKADQERSEVVV